MNFPLYFAWSGCLKKFQTARQVQVISENRNPSNMHALISTAHRDIIYVDIIIIYTFGEKLSVIALKIYTFFQLYIKTFTTKWTPLVLLMFSFPPYN